MKLPELKKKFRNRYAIKIVAGVLTVALLGSSMTAVAVQADQKEDATVETTAETGSDNKVDASDIEDLVSIKANDKEIGKDNDKYLSMQSEHIKERIGQFGDKLYLEFGGKLFNML